MKNKKFWSLTLLFAICLGVGLLYNLSFYAAGVNRDLTLVENELSEDQRKRLRVAINSADSAELLAILEENSKLVHLLFEDIESTDFNRRNRSAQYLDRFSDSVSILLGLIVASENGITHSQFSILDRRKDSLSEHLLSFINLKKQQGNGFISGYDQISQNAVSLANKLLIRFQQETKIEQQITQLAKWYVEENGAQSKINLFEKSLLRSAWNLSAGSLGFKPQLVNFDLAKNLKKDTDLIRLLSHSNKSVAMNAASLIAYFAPANAITALRFQLTQSSSNEQRFLILDAIKPYGQFRAQVEPHLRKMLQLTRDSNLREKILETIDHLNGRSNKLISKIEPLTLSDLAYEY